MIHEPAFTKEILEFLSPLDNKVIIDCTLGTGGHTLAIVEASQNVRVYAIDLDPESIAFAKKRLSKYKDRIEFLNINFAEVDEFIEEKVDGVIMDLGISSFQLDNPERGFSYQLSGPLDMRFNRFTGRPLSERLKKLSEWRIGEILKEYGEEPLARKIGREIALRKPETTEELREIVEKATRGYFTDKTLKRVFQAFRIFINQELDNLEEALPILTEKLKTGGRICVISYHSLEDRIVKNFFKNCDKLKVLTKKPMEPAEEDINKNKRIRTAKLRVAEKI